MKPGGLVRVHTSALQPNSQYKSLVISQETTSDEVLSLLLSCYNSHEPIEQFSLYEVFPGQEYQRKLHPDDLPLRAQISRQQRGEKIHFLVRRNPNYPRRRQILPPINEKHSTSTTTLQQSIDDLSFKLMQLHDDGTDKETTNSVMKNDTSVMTLATEVCNMCRNSFKTCEFCNKLSTTNKINIVTEHRQTYNPVYNLREIRTSCHSFSTFGSDKKLIEVEQPNDATLVDDVFPKNKRHSFRYSSGSSSSSGGNSQNKYACLLGGVGTPAIGKSSTTEELSENTLKGVRNFQYV